MQTHRFLARSGAALTLALCAGGPAGVGLTGCGNPGAATPAAGGDRSIAGGAGNTAPAAGGSGGGASNTGESGSGGDGAAAGTTGSGAAAAGTAGGSASAGGTAAATAGTGGGGSGAAGSAGAAAGGSAGAGGAGSAHTGPWKIMPLGDSTTAAVCYRAKLWQKLSAAGKTNIDFVGTEKSVGCSSSVQTDFDQDNEGHSCYIVSNVINLGAKPSCAGVDYKSDSTDLARWFDSQMPDIVLMHFGTNDAWNGYGPNQILAAYKAIIDKLRTRNPNVKLFVAQIIPLQPDGGKDYDAIVKALNSAIPQWASDNNQAASPIVVVDQFTGYVVATDNQADGVHPNTTGSDKIAQKWFDAISGLL